MIRGHVDPQARLRNIVARALDGCQYEGSESQEGRILLIRGQRPDGTKVRVRFLGVQDSESNELPEPGAKMRLVGVSGADKFSIWRLFMPRIPQHHFGGNARVTIGAGAAKIDVVCQDAEWWEEPPGAPETRAEAR